MVRTKRQLTCLSNYSGQTEKGAKCIGNSMGPSATYFVTHDLSQHIARQLYQRLPEEIHERISGHCGDTQGDDVVAESRN